MRPCPLLSLSFGLALAGGVAGACFDPSPIRGLPCGPGDTCPVTLRCDQTTHTCTSDAPADAGEIDAAGVDATALDAPLGACLDDNFEDGNLTGWQLHGGSWSVTAGAGNDNSFGLVSAAGNAFSAITHPSIANVTAVTVSVDFRIGASANGDFDVVFIEPGWTVADLGASSYTVGIYPTTGDNASDGIYFVDDTGTYDAIFERPVSITASAYHHLEVTRDADGATGVKLDGVDHLGGGADARLTGPLDLAFQFYGGGRIDNVVVDCTP